MVVKTQGLDRIHLNWYSHNIMMNRRIIALSVITPLVISGSILMTHNKPSIRNADITPQSSQKLPSDNTTSVPTVVAPTQTSTETTSPAPAPPPAPTTPQPTCTADEQAQLNIAKSNLDALQAYAKAQGFITYRQSDQQVLNNKINDGLAEGCVLN